MADTKFFDRRIVERNIAKGLIKEAEYKETLKKLPDDEPNAVWVEVETLEAELPEPEETFEEEDEESTVDSTDNSGGADVP
ncbi:MAG: hypothetical protein HY537_05900 [Deltaproteobacteria bacterium]|nr:hypothetical protein [Deltaproteobacteria bacterium]